MWSEAVRGDRIGVVLVWATEAGLRRIDFRSEADQARPGESLSPGPAPAHLAAALAELSEYLQGRRRAFDLPLDLSGITPFQGLVYERLFRDSVWPEGIDVDGSRPSSRVHPEIIRLPL